MCPNEMGWVEPDPSKLVLGMSPLIHGKSDLSVSAATAGVSILN